MSNFEVDKHTDKSNEENPSLLKRVLNKMGYRIIIGTAIGVIVGILYWEFIGCNGSTCPLTSNPYKTVILFALMGGWVSYKK